MVDRPKANFAKFFVGERPQVVHEWDIRARNREFLSGIDPKYFEYMGRTHAASLETDDKQYAALAIRSLYSQALETFFALLFATAQAHLAVYAWVLRYNPKDLDGLIEAMRTHQPIYSQRWPRPASWLDLSNWIHSLWRFGDSDETDRRIKEGFAQAWQRFAYDFTDQAAREEYNSIKHGLRTRSGGFHLLFGVQDELGTPAPVERMQRLGGSDFGTTYYRGEKLCDTANNFRARRCSRNWNPRNLVKGVDLLSISMENVLSFAKRLNGAGEGFPGHYPLNEETFMAPWEMGIGPITMNLDKNLDNEDVSPFSEEEIKDTFDAEYLRKSRETSG